jgi:ABC-type lipoprotein export system ATPase subunit
VFQFFDLIPELTAEENVLFPAKLAKKKETSEGD